MSELTQSKKVLVIDDDTHTNTMIVETLKMESFGVLSALSGEEALKILDTEAVDLILLDLVLPGMKGWQVVEELKNNPKTANVPIMIVSILSPEDTEIAKNHSQILGYVCKPFDVNHLIKEVKKNFHE